MVRHKHRCHRLGSKFPRGRGRKKKTTKKKANVCTEALFNRRTNKNRARRIPTEDSFQSEGAERKKTASINQSAPQSRLTLSSQRVCFHFLNQDC